jgi:4-amino-4-deoxy-L-arabinose transferase-like glycosyltransferase
VAIACLRGFALRAVQSGSGPSMNAFESLSDGSVYLLVRIINAGSSTLWLWLGMLLGLGLENKHSTAFFGVGILVGLLLTPERRHFAEKYIWLGGVIAFAIALPNILWQALHHWPTYELLSNIAHSNKNVALSPTQFIAQQINFMNPATLRWVKRLSLVVWSRASRRSRLESFTWSHSPNSSFCTAKAITSRPPIRCSLQRAGSQSSAFSPPASHG